MKKQLYILHFAGGNRYSFRYLLPNLDETVEVILLELPGRGKRMREPFVTSREEAVHDYLKQIADSRNGMPYMIYGHSMGATLSYYICMELEKLGDAPDSMLLTGSAGPGVVKDKLIHDLPKKEFVEELITMGGTPDEVLQNEELLDFYEPLLRADFKIIETDSFVPGTKLNTPLKVIMGDSEEYNDRIDNWNALGQKVFLEIVSGHHFFVYDYGKQLAARIHQGYENLVC